MVSPYPVKLAQLAAQAGDLYLCDVHKYIQVASIACCVLEAIDTLPDEIRYLWPSQWSGMKFIYLVNKYSPLIDIVFLIQFLVVSDDPHACGIQFQLRTYCFVAGTLFSELILLARTYALWDFNKPILYFTIFVSALMVPHSFYVIYDMLRWNTTWFAENGPVIQAFGCLPVLNDRDSWPAFVYLISVELVVVLLTLLRWYLEPMVFVDCTSYSSVLFCTLYRDGTWFWAIVLVFSIINILMMFFAPKELRSSMQQSVRTVHSALCTRVLLNLRKAAASTSNLGADGLTTMATLALESLPTFAPASDEGFEGEDAI